jgi:hypothetical protein
MVLRAILPETCNYFLEDIGPDGNRRDKAKFRRCSLQQMEMESNIVLLTGKRAAEMVRRFPP